MEIHSHFDLSSYNTFGLQAFAARFAVVETPDELKGLIRQFGTPQLLLGGGSNVLLTQDLEGLVVHNRILGRELVKEDESSVWVRLGAGENWHAVVQWTLEQGWYGLENLSLIPGSVGAAPIQNIGAYGVELESVFHQLEAVELESGRIRTFDREACDFGYRYSVFKGPLKGQYAITHVHLTLSKHPQLKLDYGAIRQTLEERGITRPTPKEVSEAVIHIRQSKLPDPNQLGNAGSFFKNPEIPAAQFASLQETNPQIVGYPLPNGNVKVPAGWLIEQCGWKGKKVGNTGSHARQALVLVNYGGASGREIWELAQAIQESVESRFGIRLSTEVNVI
jgi:UDP-N-acetylmuramate dehydrogenase